MGNSVSPFSFITSCIAFQIKMERGDKRCIRLDFLLGEALISARNFS